MIDFTNAVEELTQLIDKYSNYTEVTPEEDMRSILNGISLRKARSP